MSKGKHKKSIEKVNKKRTNSISLKYLFKSKVLLLIIAIISISIVGSLGKFTAETIKETYLESKGFYFYSNVIKENKTYTLNNWDGVSSYTFAADVLNYKNNFVWTKENITYNVVITTPEGISCETSGGNNNKVLEGDSIDKKTSILKFTVTNTGANLEQGDYVDIKITINATSPYTKSLNATFRIYVTSLDINYYVVDSVGSKYATLYISNNTNSKNINVKLDASKVQIDNTNTFVINSDKEYTKIDEIEYITKIKNITITKDNVYAIRFYKINPNNNYWEDTSAIFVETI